METTVILVASFLAAFVPAFALLVAGLARLAARRAAPSHIAALKHTDLAPAADQ